MNKIVTKDDIEWKQLGEEGRGHLWVSKDGAVRRTFKNPYSGTEEWGIIQYPDWGEDGKLMKRSWNGHNVHVETLIALTWKQEDCPSALLMENELCSANSRESLKWAVYRGSKFRPSTRLTEATMLLFGLENIKQVATKMSISESTVWRYIYDSCVHVYTTSSDTMEWLRLFKKLTLPSIWKTMLDLHTSRDSLLSDRLGRLVGYLQAELEDDSEWKTLRCKYDHVRILRFLLHKLQSDLIEKRSKRAVQQFLHESQRQL